MDARDLEIRNVTYALFAETGTAPRVADVAGAAGIPDADAADAWQRLHDGHALVLDAATGDLLMANPFSAIPTPYRVEAGGRSWYANCAWDALGICAALHADGTVATECADCGEPIALQVRNRQVDDDSLVFHCLVPAARWWEDIVFT